MPRPFKRRRIGALPGSSRFGPVSGISGRQVINMTLDEFEAIRLIDLEGLTQEQCAERMDVARTTAQAIYNSARVKLAECLVNEKELFISGGDYILSQDGHGPWGYGHHHRGHHHGQNENDGERKD